MTEDKQVSKWDWLGPLLCLGLGLAPIAVAMAAGLGAALLGCRFDEAGTDPCIRAGIPFGSMLYPFGVAGWFTLLTLPVGGAAAFIWTCWSVWKNFLRKKVG